jgi:hypothetical protein
MVLASDAMVNGDSNSDDDKARLEDATGVEEELAISEEGNEDSTPNNTSDEDTEVTAVLKANLVVEIVTVRTDVEEVVRD